MSPHIPNLHSLLAGVAVSFAFSTRQLIVGHLNIGMLVYVLCGIPIAFLFQMFSNPKDRKGIDWGMVLTIQICALMWPLILLAMWAGKPWKEPKWINRERHSTVD